MTLYDFDLFYKESLTCLCDERMAKRLIHYAMEAKGVPPIVDPECELHGDKLIRTFVSEKTRISDFKTAMVKMTDAFKKIGGLSASTEQVNEALIALDRASKRMKMSAPPSKAKRL